MEEEMLIRRAQAGDVNTFNQLVEMYQDLAYSQAVWMLKDPDEAEDAAQEAFIKAFQHLSSFRGTTFKSWLVRIVKNTCLDRIRQQKRAPILPLIQKDEDGEERDLTEWLVDPGLSVEEQMERTELQASLQRYLDELGEIHKEVLVLVDIQEMDYQEAAHILGVPIGTIRSRLARARQQLAQRIVGSPDFETAAMISAPASLEYMSH